MTLKKTLKIPTQIKKNISERIRKQEVAIIEKEKCNHCHGLIINKTALFCKHCGFLFLYP